tara:strand:+ start:2045 stop:2893 length:849 start_codon:yes stop_codon:yes gene_type:complete
MTGFLVDQAREDGFEIALVFDVDEFFDVRDGSHYSSLARAIQGEISDVGHLRVEMNNYAPYLGSQRFNVANMTMLRRRIEDRRMELVSCGPKLANVKVFLAPLQKTIFRISLVKTGSPIEAGNHYAPGKARNISEIVVRHVPVSCYDHFVDRYSQHEGFEAMVVAKGHAAHTRAYAKISREAWAKEFNTKWCWGDSDGQGVEVESGDEFFKVIARKAQNITGGEFIEGLNEKSGKLTSTENSELSELLDARGTTQNSRLWKKPSYTTRVFRVLMRLRFSAQR